MSSTFDLIAHLRRQREWSEKTFGPGARPAGVIDHIRKELREIEQAPADLIEWIDVAILAFDGAWRAGHSPEAIAAALAAKQAKNESRTWPDWRTAEPGKAIEHVRELTPLAAVNKALESASDHLRQPLQHLAYWFQQGAHVVPAFARVFDGQKWGCSTEESVLGHIGRANGLPVLMTAQGFETALRIAKGGQG